MKELSVTFNFITPDESDLSEARDLTDYIIDCIWDMWHDLGYYLNDYKINFTEIAPNDFGEPNCKSIDFHKYYKEDEDDAGE